MAVAVVEHTSYEPSRTLCNCGEAVLVCAVPAVPRHGKPERIVFASPFEWQPRTVCYVCANNAKRWPNSPKRQNCSRCGGTGYVGEQRPTSAMLAIDIAWSDDGHVRVIEPGTERRKGEALHQLHVCGHTC